jgi:hypothetical protein
MASTCRVAGVTAEDQFRGEHADAEVVPGDTAVALLILELS